MGEQLTGGSEMPYLLYSAEDDEMNDTERLRLEAIVAAYNARPLLPSRARWRRWGGWLLYWTAWGQRQWAYWKPITPEEMDAIAVLAAHKIVPALLDNIFTTTPLFRLLKRGD